MNGCGLAYLAGFALGSGQSAAPLAVSAPAAHPVGALTAARLRCQPSSLRFARLPQGEKLRETVDIANEGPVPLRIGEVATSCLCVHGEVADSTVPPGGHTRLLVTFDSRGLLGAVHREIYLLSNDASSPSTRIDLDGEVVAAGRVEPALLAWEKLSMGESARRSVRIEAKGSVSGGVSSDPAYRVENLRRNGSAWSADVVATGCLPIGLHDGEIGFDAGSTRLTLRVISEVSP